MRNKILKNNKKGFVILFAVTISSILLAIALGVANIALKEVAFSTSVRDTNDAFFSADTGIEYVLFNDKSPSIYPVGVTDVYLSGLGSTGQGCAHVTITKTSTPSTTVISKGYNLGGSVSNACTPPASSVERELKATY